jgi:hypothetical protein
VLCGRPDFAFVADAPSADSVWLLGPDAADRIAAVGKLAPRYLSRAFEEGGVYVMRDGWERDSNHLVIDCGPHGTMNCGHAHADALAFELALKGEPVFVDPGTFTYTVNPTERDAFRSSLAHNAATVDGEGSSEPNGPFHWRRVASANALAWRTQNGGRAAYFEGSHSGFEHLPSPVHYRRAVEFDSSKEQMIVLRDRFDCKTAHTASLSFQCAAGIQVVRVAANRVELARAGQPICQLETIGQGEFEIEDAWVSRVYGARERATRCRFVARLSPGTTTLTSTVSLAPVKRAASVVEQFAPVETR